MDGDGIMRALEETLFGYPIRCQLTKLDDGLHVLLTGGCRSHIGAISTAGPGEETKTQVFPGHKDQFVSEPWAAALAEKTGRRTCVVCGIHYDNATKAQIEEILRCTQRLLAQVLTEIDA